MYRIVDPYPTDIKSITKPSAMDVVTLNMGKEAIVHEPVHNVVASTVGVDFPVYQRPHKRATHHNFSEHAEAV